MALGCPRASDRGPIAAGPLRWLATLLLGVLLVWGLAWGRWTISHISEPWAASSGIAVAGGLRGGRSLRPSGPDHRSASLIDGALGRQYLHPDLAALLDVAFADERAALAVRRGHEVPAWRVAETGWRPGGWFPPHLTHQDGLSVDIVTPLETGRVPSWPWLALGYGVQISEEGVLAGQGSVDTERLARLFDAICVAAPKHDLVARQFIVWAPWQGKIRGRMRSSCRERLVDAHLAHDDHVHITLTGTR